MGVAKTKNIIKHAHNQGARFPLPSGVVIPHCSFLVQSKAFCPPVTTLQRSVSPDWRQACSSWASSCRSRSRGSSAGGGTEAGVGLCRVDIPGDTPPWALAGPHMVQSEENSAARSLLQLPGVGQTSSCGAHGFSCPLSCSWQCPLHVSSRCAHPCSVLDLHFLCVWQNLPAPDLSWKTKHFIIFFFLKVKY